MFVNRLAQPRVRLTLICAGAMTLATLGFGVASAKAAPALVDDPIPVPAPLGTPVPLGTPSPLGVPSALGTPSPLGMPGPAAGSSAAGVNAANSFLQVLNGMLNKVVPGVGSIMPTDVSSLTPPGAPMSAVPALETPPAPPTPPALVPQTLAGARTFH
ncbi:hypothetical protein [Mycolicibacter heraklionensis]|uniref:hypothetical protein n=1 Tax=Mycolicibacter heraklionensis TaxID=512402 RepID=UPI000A484C7B|nr:hypothetical protein [Mycolicibacter heraklionensis]